MVIILFVELILLLIGNLSELIIFRICGKMVNLKVFFDISVFAFY